MKNYLFAPGPTPIPTETLLAMALPIDYHRASESVELLGNVAAKLKYVFQTKNDRIVGTRAEFNIDSEKLTIFSAYGFIAATYYIRANSIRRLSYDHYEVLNGSLER